jgi:hypothetical protein
MSHEEQKSYVPRTIHEQNRGRLSILPIIPERATDGRFHLLLANVPGLLLSEEELARRQPHRFQFPHLVTSNTQSYPSDLAIYYQRHYLDLMQRLQMDAAILDCNYIRLRYCLRLFADQRIRCLHVPPFDVQLPENEQPLAMEFFLQIDGQLNETSLDPPDMLSLAASGFILHEIGRSFQPASGRSSLRNDPLPPMPMV